MGLLQHTKSRRSSGFGLIELVITIAIVAILTAIALPSFGYSIRNNRVSTQTNDFLSALNYARNEAIMRTRGVTICAADTTAAIPPTACGTAATWRTGWMVVVDDTVGNGAPVLGAAPNVLRTWMGNPRNDLTTTPAFIRFNPRGQTAATVAFTLKPLTDCANDQQRTITVNELGRSRSVKGPCV